jgi:acetylglutamate kinase
LNSANGVIVIKLGGSVISSKDSAVQSAVGLQKSGRRVVLVHGGASLVTKWLAAQGVASEFQQGERITDAKSLDVVIAVLAGLANKETTAAIIDAGGKAAGISGIDGKLIQGRVRDPKLGFLGDIVKVDPAILETLLNDGFIPVVSPVSMNAFDRGPQDPLLLNINGDAVAGEIATALHADQLVFLTDVDGVRDRGGKVIRNLSPAETESLLADGTAYGGMIPKLKACLRAARAGTTCRIADGRMPGAADRAISGNFTGSTIHAAGR